jgi:hypothetical protein
LQLLRNGFPAKVEQHAASRVQQSVPVHRGFTHAPADDTTVLPPDAVLPPDTVTTSPGPVELLPPLTTTPLDKVTVFPLETHTVVP